MWDHGVRVSGPEHVRVRPVRPEESQMSKRGRKRRSRKGSAANHGRRPNA
ncbi:hypothetical protein GCM10010972_26310 [Cellulomonas carbonis]|nr:hypothetical protein GCM10010972_26310 [Cellulomonas carbonis]